MSHAVTITRTTTTTSTTALIVNTGYLKTVPGLLKLGQLILGAVCVGLMGTYINRYLRPEELFFLLMSVTFMIGTFCLLVACLISLATSSIISKTIYEVVYHLLAFVLYLAAGLALIIETSKRGKRAYEYEPFLAASIIALVVAVLYFISSVFALRSYRGL